MNEQKIALFLADDNEMVVEGLMALVANDPDIEVVGHCGEGLKVLGEVQATQPDVLVLDISLPGMNGLEVCRRVKQDRPQTKILMLSMNLSERIVIGALNNGASGYLIKEAVAGEFRRAIHTVARGETYLAPVIDRAILDKVRSKEPTAQVAPADAASSA